MAFLVDDVDGMYKTLLRKPAHFVSCLFWMVVLAVVAGRGGYLGFR
jgi:hypothetical protein